MDGDEVDDALKQSQEGVMGDLSDYERGRRDKQEELADSSLSRLFERMEKLTEEVSHEVFARKCGVIAGQCLLYTGREFLVYEMMAKSASESAVNAMDSLTDSERLEVMGRYCHSCGRVQPEERSCQCWNDE